MVRLLFMSAVAFVAYKYIGRSNRKHQSAIMSQPGTLEILPPELVSSARVVTAPEQPKQTATRSAAAEPDPYR